jgi:hypothetical protein
VKVELESMWKKRPWPFLRFNPSIFLKILRKVPENLRLDSQSADRDPNWDLNRIRKVNHLMATFGKH